MGNIGYLQCDLRFNEYLLHEIEGMTVIEHTINKIKKIDCEKIIAGVYDCKENMRLIPVLEKQGIQIIITKENNVNRRFVESVMEENADYVIRVGADALLLDVKKENEILKKMKLYKKDFFYESDSTCILPDVVRLECLKLYKEAILQKERYFEALLEEKNVSRYQDENLNILLFDFRVNSRETYRVCKNVIENNLDIYVLSRKLAEKIKRSNNYLSTSGILGSWILAEAYDDFFYDEDGIVNPWFGRTVIDFLKGRLKKDMRVFEWGCGNSTLFWSHYVKEVVSVEHNFAWYEKMKRVVSKNVKLQHKELMFGGGTALASYKRKKILTLS